MKIRNYLGLLAILFFATACPNDDDDDDFIVVEERDRGEQSIADDQLIREYLETHFYNYDEFQNPTTDFDFRIVFDTIAGENSDRTPLIIQVVDTTYNRFETNNTLYKLTVRSGSGNKKSTHADSLLMTLRGDNIYAGGFENIVNPVWFDLLSTVDGFMQGLANTRGASGLTINNDGTVDFNNDYEIGAIFVPSGLGFAGSPPSTSIPQYSSLIFTYDVFNVIESDHDNDGIITLLEDVDNNGSFFDDIDDTDEDLFFNFSDPDDDGDGVLTELEIETVLMEIENNQGQLVEVEVFQAFLDTDGDGISDHLDDDDDGDGIDTVDEININTATGVVTFPDTDEDGIPDYLDQDS